MSVWTLVYGGTEQALADWGICAGFEATFSNKAVSTLTFRTTENFDDGAPQFTSFPAWFRANPADSPASQLVKVYRDRTSVGSGGTVYFAGYFDDPTRLVEEGKQYIQYVLKDVLWLFERNQFKQYRNQITAFTSGAPSAWTKVVCPECFLGDNWNTGALFKQKEQIQEVIDWMNESYNPTRRNTGVNDATKDVVQAGTLNPAVKAPRQRANTFFCLEAINNVCRWIPDVIYKVNHTTTPPTLHVLTMGKWSYATDPPTFTDYTNLPEVTINITTAQEKKIQMQTQAARQLAGVILYYLSSDTVDDQTVPVIVRDAYPGGTTDFYPEVSCHAVELDGRKLTHVKASVVVNENTDGIAAVQSGTAATRKKWWVGDTATSKKAHTDHLKDPKIKPDTISIVAATVKDAAGNNVTLADYPNELCSDLPDWVIDTYGLHKKRVTVMAEATYDRYTEGTPSDLTTYKNKEHSKTHHVLTKSLWLTDAVTQEYTAVQTDDPGEAAPEGVAESVYRAVAIAQQAGTVEFANSQLRSDIYIGCRLKLVGPTTTFTNILPQQITAQPHYGITTVRFGPSATVDADGLIELARATRFRLVYNMPTHRNDGLGAGGNGSVDQSARSALEDSGAGVGGSKFTADTFTPS
jgi:hypothetical protein